MSEDKMIAVLRKSEDYEDKTQRIVVTINAPIFVQTNPNCAIQWKRSNYSRLGETWDSFSPTDHEDFDLERTNIQTITLNVRISTLFISPL